jgi:hypothetical protein
VPELLTKFESFGNFFQILAILFESTLGKKKENSMYCFGELSRCIMIDAGCKPYMLLKA